MKNKLQKVCIAAVLVLCGGTSLQGCKAREPDLKETAEESGSPAESYVSLLTKGELVCASWEEADSLAKVDEQELLDAVCPAVVRIEAGQLFGSGIIFDMRQEEILLLTNRHMIEPAEPVVVFQDGIRAEAEVIGYSEKYDVGFLRVKLADLGYYTAERYRCVRYNETEFEKLEPGDDLFILGSADYPAGNLFFGIIGNCSVYMEDFGTEMLWAYCEVKPGMSGSGVFDKDGRLIGIVCGGNEEKEAAVLPLDKILAEWRAGGY